jgi:hypothetical protein
MKRSQVIQRLCRSLFLGACFAVLAATGPALVFGADGYGRIDPPQTGQMGCFDAGGDLISCQGSGQDGEFHMGAAWPVPRFVNNGDGTITDLLTSLMWLQDGSCLGDGYWAASFVQVLDLNLDPENSGCLGYTQDYSDWRVPNINELFTLLNWNSTSSTPWLNSQGFANVHWAYWSSTRLPNNKKGWTINLGGMHPAPSHLVQSEYIWAVRLGPKGIPSGNDPTNAAMTGQISCWDPDDNPIDCAATGHDGELHWGVMWPSPRFVDNEDGTVTDKLTGLMWLKEVDCLGARDWMGAFERVEELNRSPSDPYIPVVCSGIHGEYRATYNDWRLPNMVEIQTLQDFERSGVFLPVEAENLFIGLHFASIWASTTAYPDEMAYTKELLQGTFTRRLKTSNGNIVWPVRSGLIDGEPVIYRSGFEYGGCSEFSSSVGCY